MVNVLWGTFNFLVGYALLKSFGGFVPGLNLDSLVTLAGGLFTALALSWHFHRVRQVLSKG